jgi:hypothetical protein
MGNKDKENGDDVEQEKREEKRRHYDQTRRHENQGLQLQRHITFDTIDRSTHRRDSPIARPWLSIGRRREGIGQWGVVLGAGGVPTRTSISVAFD